MQGDLRAVLPHRHVPSDIALAIYYLHRSGLPPRVRVVVDTLLSGLRALPMLTAKPQFDRESVRLLSR